jgi:NAD(P)-dependent dehydrogenase (short-subunit alcohol dehydrogenase family)
LKLDRSGDDVRRTAIIISVSSDLGAAIASRWLDRGWDVLGTYRTRSQALENLESAGLKSVYCDLASADSIATACTELKSRSEKWDALVLCTGSQNPVGMFTDTDFAEWESSIRVNFTAQLGVVHELLSYRVTDRRWPSPCVLFFAGGGTNNAVIRYSAYTISKIALIKMCELLDAEIPDTRFTIIGPGFVDTKIHQATLDAGANAGDHLEFTRSKLVSDDMTPITAVVDCCDWVVDARREIIGGRNFSLVFDSWGTPELDRLLSDDPNMYRLRRSGNDRLVTRRV